ncbi:hypothetical protein PQR57_41950 [Paraburkholderia dipogonis]|uniref:Uncharacterized protein n=1 Tax=Paraburkholderia dipogonis TaxID=1211383 RepID=A0ABW9B5N8_9BURK
METLKAIVAFLPQAATSPYAVICYVATLLAYVVVYIRVARLKLLLSKGEIIGAKSLAKIIQQEIGGGFATQTLPPVEYLRALIHRYVFIAFIATLLCGVAVFAIVFLEMPAPKITKTNDEKLAMVSSNSPRSYIENLFGPPARVTDVHFVKDDGTVTDETVPGEEIARYENEDFALELLYKNNVVASYSVLALKKDTPLVLSDGTDVGGSTFAQPGGTPSASNNSPRESYYGQLLPWNSILKSHRVLAYVSSFGFPYRDETPADDQGYLVPLVADEIVFKAASDASGTEDFLSKIDDAEFKSFVAHVKPNGYVMNYSTDSTASAGLIAHDFVAAMNDVE